MTASEGEALEQALAAWLEAREDDPDLLPSDFAEGLEPALRSAFLRELEELAALDQKATLAPPRDLPLRFGDFRILRQLGQGGMGTVYEAEQVSTQARVALKILHPHFAGDARTAARFEREAHTASSLVHPHIVRIRGFGHHEDSAWIAMDLVRGRSLQRLLAAALDPRDADHARARSLFDDHRALCNALADAADALDFAHRHGVVHRDVKPANLMIDDGGRVLVLDFGLASTRWDSADLTRTGDFLGTPLYMSPEQASGDRRVGPGSDIYSLGAVLYEALTGRPPVAPGPLPAILDGIRHSEPSDPRKLVADVPPDLALVARKCLEKEARWRYGSAAELADDLRRFVDGSAVQARPAGQLVRMGRRIRRRPVLAASAAVLVVLAGAASWYGLQRGASAARLQLDSDLRDIAAELALSPQGITAFGGSARRWFESFGMGDHLPPAELAVAPAARSALAHAETLAQQHPGDLRALRLLARVRMDLGTDPAAARAAVEQLLTAQGSRAESRDRALLAVQLLLEGKVQDAEAAFEQTAKADSGPALFYRALYQQVRQDYAQAIAAFTKALQAPDLDEELRYFALLHRGWCRTCPEVGELRAAQDDLLQASTLRPHYGTARLLWAGLRCLEPDAASLQAAVQAVTEVLTAVKMEPWVVVLTARVLLQFAEGSTQQAGPVRFSDGLAPLVALPLEPARREALAATALQLLDGVVEAKPELWEPQVHRVAALVLLDRHAEALQVVEQLGRMPGASAPLTALLAARVHLAAGHTRAARERIEAALRADPRYAAAHLLAADLARYVGDANAELAALRAAATVLPQQAPALPHLQERIARLLLATGRPEEAIATVAATTFGNVLAGCEAPRARAERAVIRAQAEAARSVGGADLRAALQHAEREIETAAPAPEQPLHALLTRLAPLYQRLGEGAQTERLQQAGASGHWDWWMLLALQQRGWLELSDEQRFERLSKDPARHVVPMAEELAQVCRRHEELRGDVVVVLGEVCKQAPGDTAAVAALAAELHRAGHDDRCVEALKQLESGPASQALAPLVEEAPNLPPAALDQLLVLARARGAEQDNSEARLLQAAVLYVRGDHRAAAEFLQRTQPLHPDDLRGRFLLACAALHLGRTEAARAALRGADGAALLPASALPVVQRACGVQIDDETARSLAALL